MPHSDNPGLTLTIGVSTKMYFSHAQTVEWTRAVAEIARRHPAVIDGSVELFVIPSYPSIPAVLDIVQGTPITVGAQDVATEDAGAFTGEVSGAVLAELGVRVAEVGHAERRHLFGESDEVVRAKTEAALRNGLVPVLCIGESVRDDVESAVAECIRQLDSALFAIPDGGSVIVAYEPHWAIGEPEPASTEHIVGVCTALRTHLAADERLVRGTVIYGGSAGPGLLTRIGDAVDGLFLGRFAHDPAAVAAVIDEAAALVATGEGNA